MKDELLYEQIIKEIRRKIESGEILPGDKAPSIAVIRREFHVSPVTAVRALKELTASGYLEKLPGRKYLITGNHDGSVKAYSNYFQTTAQILDLTVRPSMCSRLTDNMVLNLCHYPLLTWNRKPHGSVMLHGHCHGKLDEYNRQSPDLRFDVGIDGELSRRCGGFISVEAVYDVAMEKTKGESFTQYARQNYLPEYR